MTLRVVCGSGHVSEYNLTAVPLKYFVGDKDSGHSALWSWDIWSCKVAGCEHRHYVSHLVDKQFTVYDNESGASYKGSFMAFMLLALFLSRKIGGI